MPGMVMRGESCFRAVAGGRGRAGRARGWRPTRPPGGVTRRSPTATCSRPERHALDAAGSSRPGASLARRNRPTEADRLFEAYLDSRGIPNRFEPPWSDVFGVEVAANPDFLIEPDGARDLRGQAVRDDEGVEPPARRAGAGDGCPARARLRAGALQDERRRPAPAPLRRAWRAARRRARQPGSRRDARLLHRGASDPRQRSADVSRRP